MSETVFEGGLVGNVDATGEAARVTTGSPASPLGVAYVLPPVEADPLWYPATVVPLQVPRPKRRRGLRALLRGWRP